MSDGDGEGWGLTNETVSMNNRVEGLDACDDVGSPEFVLRSAGIERPVLWDFARRSL